MSKAILIIGESGSGKTTSCRNLDPATTFYVDCDGKGLSWRGWRKQYNKESKNYLATNNPITVLQLLQRIDANQPHIKTVVIDTLNGIMVSEEAKNRNQKGYDKWSDLAFECYDIFSSAYSYRNDLTIVFNGHAQTDRTDDGFFWTRMKTSGRKLDKINIEAYFTIVLLSKVKDGNYVFETKSKNSTAKTPLGLFDEDEIPNDICEVIKKLEEYEND